jgi:ABC-2 type transport system permease protein
VVVIAAILRAQWLSMRLGGNRGAVFSAITTTAWYGLWSIISWFGFQAARRASAEMLSAYLPFALLGIWIYWQAMPILSASMGSSLDLQKLRIYPIPHGSLFRVEMLLRAVSSGEMLLFLAAGTTGLASNPHISAWRAAIAAVPFAAFNVLLSSGARSLLERLLSRRRVREVLVFLLLMLWMVPRLLFLGGQRTKLVRGWSGVMETPLWPWTAAAWTGLGHSAAAAFLCLAAWTLAAALFARAQFERSLRFDAVAAQATPAANGPTRARSLTEALYRFPSALLRDPLAAIVEKELRSLARTPRFRMVFVMGFSFGVMVWLPMILGGGTTRHSTLSQNFLTVVCVYALTLLGQVSYWNCFGFDRSAVQIYYAAPQSIRTTLLGKNIASLVFIYLEALILSAVVAIFRVGVRPAGVLETFLVLAVCALYMLAMGNISSVQYPRGLNPERVSQGGASSRFQALIFLLYPLALFPVFLAYLARYALSSELVFYLVLAMAAVIGGAVYWIAMDSAAATAIGRREQIIGELSHADGPIAAD